MKTAVKRISRTEKIRRLAAKEKTIPQIVKATGASYQTVWRTLNRKNRTILSPKNFAEPSEDATPCNNAECISGKSRVCECQCMGAFHGAAMRPMTQEEAEG